MNARVSTLHENLEKYFVETPLEGSVLCVDDFPKDLPQADSIDCWHTRYNPHHSASPTPQQDSLYDAVLIRLPKSHDYFDFILHATGPHLRPDGQILVYGLNDEGIKGSQKKLAEFFGEVEAVFIKNKGRIIRCKKPLNQQESFDLSSFCTKHSLAYAEKTFDLEYYPGMFLHGKLDDGTKLLLDTFLPREIPERRILDYASGSGIISMIFLDQFPDARVDLLDNDSLSMISAENNVPNAREYYLGDALGAIPPQTNYELIISNPPIHTEKEEHRRTLHKLISDAPRYLSKNGRLVFVVQSRIPIQDELDKSFRSYRKLAETTQFCVWEARK